jgi:hypothetical protein
MRALRRRELLIMHRHGAALLLAAVLAASVSGGGVGAAERPGGLGVAGAWHGTSSGSERGPCGALTFDVRVDGGRIGGFAHSRTDDGRPIEWRLFGLIDSAGQVTLETSHVVASPERHLEHVAWTGRVEGGHIRLSRAAQGACTEAQTIELSRD